MFVPVIFCHAADFSSPWTILALVFIALGVLFIFLYNSLTMRRTQLDRQIEHVRMILRRRRELAEAMIPDLPAVLVALPVAELLQRDRETAPKVNSLSDADPEKLEEYRKLKHLLTEVLEPCRAALEQYNRIVDHPDARRIMKLLRFKPREHF